MAGKRNGKDDSNPMTVPIIVIMVVVGLTALAIVLAVQQSGDDDDGSTYDRPSNGDTGPDDGENGGEEPEYLSISLETTGGSSIDLGDYKGRVVLLDMFATWCGPCKTQIEEFKDLRSGYSSSDLVIISVDVDLSESIPKIRDFKEETGSSWTFVRSTDEFNSRFPATSIPTLYMLDRSGEVVYNHVGVESAGALSSEIDKHI